jgi:hypothetical protein
VIESDQDNKSKEIIISEHNQMEVEEVLLPNH